MAQSALIETRLQINHIAEGEKTRIFDFSKTLECTIQDAGLWRITNLDGQPITAEGANKNATIAAWWQAWLERE